MVLDQATGIRLTAIHAQPEVIASGIPIMGQPDTGDTAWMLASSALGAVMTPGLAFFYGGMVRTRKRAQHDHDERQRYGPW